MEAWIEIFNQHRFWIMPAMLAGVLIALAAQVRVLFSETTQTQSPKPELARPDLAQRPLGMMNTTTARRGHATSDTQAKTSACIYREVFRNPGVSAHGAGNLP